MPRDRIAFLADGHITSDDPERIETLCRALAGLAGTAAVVCILGDLFEVWLGAQESEPHVARVGAALVDLRAKGIRTIYVEGNRDFRIDRGAAAGYFDAVVRGETIERFGSARFHLSHGDGVNDADWQYRIWRAFSKGLLVPALLPVLPPARARALAHHLERRFRGTNRRHKAQFPESRCLEFARRRVDAGADVVVVGHFHHEYDREVSAGNRKGRFVSLPFWREEPRPVVFDGEGNRIS